MSLEIEKYNCRIRFTEDLLGTVPKNPEVYKSHIAAKAREMIVKEAAKGVPLASGKEATDMQVEIAIAEEEESLEDIEEKGWTGFHTDKEGPFLFDYAIKGFLCEAARALREWGEGEKNVKQLQDKVKRYVFVFPRKIRLPHVTSSLERSLRAQTAQGPRVTVVRSDVVPTDTEIDFQIKVFKATGVRITRNMLLDILEYGTLIGIGQWRTGGHGRFEVVYLELEGDEPDRKPRKAKA